MSPLCNTRPVEQRPGHPKHAAGNNGGHTLSSYTARTVRKLVLVGTAPRNHDAVFGVRGTRELHRGGHPADRGWCEFHSGAVPAARKRSPKRHRAVARCCSGLKVVQINTWGLNMMEKDLIVIGNGLTVIQRVAICFAAGVIGALAVVLFSHVLFGLGLSGTLGVEAPVSLKAPDIYRPLFWGGLWGIPFGLLVKTAWKRLYLFGLLYFLAPVLALFTIFLPLSGAGFFGLEHGGPMFTVYLLLVNLPFGIITALAARAIIGKKP